MTSKKQTRKQLHIQRLMTEPNAQLETFHGMEIITYNPLCVAIFKPRTIKPVYHYICKTQEQRANFIDKQKQYIIDENKRREQYLQKCEADKEKFKAGVILYTSWGWEQTNIDFYLITERNKQTVTLQEIGQKRTQDGWASGKCLPDTDNPVGEPFKKRITKYANIRIDSFRNASIFDGKPKYWSSYA